MSGEGLFTAVGAEDWDNGYGCGSCAELEYKGNVVTVNVVDRCFLESSLLCLLL